MFTILIYQIAEVLSVEGMRMGTALLMYMGVGAAVAGLLLVLIGLCLLIVTRVKRGGEARHKGSVAYSHPVTGTSPFVDP